MGEGQKTSDPLEGKIGPVLERARKDRGLTIEEAERATKIRKRYLEGLERDDYTVLPDAVYARGFLKTYANFLGLDGAGLSQELRSRRKPRRERGLSYHAPKSEFERPIITPGGVRGARRRRVSRSTIITVLVALAALAALVGVLYYVGLNVRSSATEDRERLAQTAARVNSDVEARRQTQGGGDRVPADEVPSGRLTIAVEVEGAPAWIRVRSDSETVFEEIAQPGFSRTFEAKRMVGIRTGDAGAVSVEVNGQDFGTLGEPGQIGDRNFTLKPSS